MPSGAVITYEIYSDGELDEIFVMEKRTDSDWGNQNPEGTPRTGDWLFQEFNGDRSLDYEEGVGRCFSCHANSERDDFVKRFDELQSYDLEDLTASMNSDSDIQLAGVFAEDWEVRELVNQLDTPHGLDDEESSLPNIDVADNMLSVLSEDYRWSEVHESLEKAGIIDQTLSAVYLQQFLGDITKNEFPAG
ncbi:cytochrome P460 family protein [Oceanobacillus picturae]|uniref:cytochrome P460 family protein n=1 Tax=Oceanobacillus picturae TaxID=171693 RepID=UPI00364458E9